MVFLNVFPALARLGSFGFFSLGFKRWQKPKVPNVRLVSACRERDCV
jgi:hypothetical protein